MELVARDLKSLGLYTARALSFAGVEYEIPACLTSDQIAVYDAYACLGDHPTPTCGKRSRQRGSSMRDSGSTLNSGARPPRFRSSRGTKQRFFAQLLLSMKLPSLLPAIERALADGNAGGATCLDRRSHAQPRLADLSDAEREALEIDLSPARIRVMLSSTLYSLQSQFMSSVAARGAGFLRFSMISPRYYEG